MENTKKYYTAPLCEVVSLGQSDILTNSTVPDENEPIELPYDRF